MVLWRKVELPGFDAPLVPVPPERRAAFARNVRDILDDVKKPAAKPAPVPEHADAEGEACATCRGFCCGTGGDAAYLNPKSIARYWGEHPHLKKDDLVAEYLAAIPDVTLQGSCIFHTARGCNLPPAMRSNVCHEYQCGPLREALYGIKPRRPGAPAPAPRARGGSP